MTVDAPRLARVLEGHMADLAKSGLTPETILAAGIYSASAAEASALVGYGIGPALVFPYERDGSGQPTYARVKLDQSDDPKRRYRAPSGRGNRLYIPFTIDAYALTNPNAAIYITEGEKKTLCAVQHRLNCIGVSGVYNSSLSGTILGALNTTTTSRGTGSVDSTREKAFEITAKWSTTSTGLTATIEAATLELV